MKTIGEKARRQGSYFILDGTQVIGAAPVDIDELKVDALVCAGYKWLLAPYSISVSYFGERFDGGDPLEEYWINKVKSDDFAKLTTYQDEYRNKAHRYSMGEQSNLILAPMMAEGLRQVLEWGVENIQKYCRSLMEHTVDELKELALSVESSTDLYGHIFGVNPEGLIDLDVLFNEFERNKIYVSRRGRSIRISLHVYNDLGEMELLVQCFRKALGK